MRVFTKFLLSLLPLTIFPALLMSFVVMHRGNTEIEGLLHENLRLELEFFRLQCSNEAAMLTELGLEGQSFYVENAQGLVLEYARQRHVQGGFLYVLDGSLKPVYLPDSIDSDVKVMQMSFEPWGWELGIAVYDSYIGQFQRKALVSTSIISLGILIPTLFVGFVLTRLVIRPVRKLESASNAMAEGHLQTRVSITTNDEYEQMAESFNLMASSIESLTTGLESQVQKRTEELEHSLSELKRTQDELIKRERLANLGSLVSGLAHEINTPLGVGITGSSHLGDMVQDFRETPDGDFEDFLNRTEEVSDLILKNLTRLGSLVSTFKTLSVENIFEEKVAFDLHTLVRVEASRIGAAHTDVTLQISVKLNGITEITSYPGIFRQIFSHLIENSYVHGFDPGSEGVIRVELDRTDGDLVVLYEDNGKGISTDYQENLYEPFTGSRLHSSGPGLGMNIVFNLINRGLNGRIELNTSAESGVSFLIRIPWNGD